MPRDVIMPALGMAQDTGKIVSWLKSPGEPVAEGEPLFEVETDKAVMEVPAPASGFLSDVTGQANQDIAVGLVIARIVESADAAASGAAPPAELDTPIAAEPTAPPESGPVAPPRPEPRPTEAPAGLHPKVAPASRLLASPKARSLAEERGIDLAALRIRGAAEPIHAADLDRAASGQMSVLAARADSAALDALLAREDAGLDFGHLLAAFAARAWAMVNESEEPGIIVQHPDGASDIVGAGAPRLRLIDLTGTRLTFYVPTGSAPTLTVARDGATLVLSLAFAEPDMSFAAAFAWLDELAARFENPIRQLL